MIFRIMVLIGALTLTAQAMLSDGIHLPQAYVEFANTQKAFQASCFVYDHRRHVLQTGVLIAPDIIMTAAHGFDGDVHLPSLIIGFGEKISREGNQNYAVRAIRRHPSYRREPFPLQAKYDMAFIKLTRPVKGIEPVPLFEEEVFEEIPALSVATFGSADIAAGVPVYRRAFVLPEADIFSVSSDDPETLHSERTVMMGSVFFKPADNLKPVKPHAPEQEVRTYKANRQWLRLGKPPFALTLPGSSGAPVFMQVIKNGIAKTYVFGIIQSFSHLSSSSFHHPYADREVHHLLKAQYPKIYGNYQSVFCIPYEVHTALRPGQKSVETYKLPAVIRKILAQLKK